MGKSKNQLTRRNFLASVDLLGILGLCLVLVWETEKGAATGDISVLKAGPYIQLGKNSFLVFNDIHNRSESFSHLL